MKPLLVKGRSTGQSHLVLVKGSSGSGNSSLVEQLRSLVVVDDEAYFVSGKFDQYNESDTFSGFVSAFSDLCGLVSQSADIDKIRGDLSVELKDELHSLIRLIPSLYLVTGTANEIGGLKALTDNARQIPAIVSEVPANHVQALLICAYRDDEFEIDLPFSLDNCDRCRTIKVNIWIWAASIKSSGC
jgi:predicted ATPase